MSKIISLDLGDVWVGIALSDALHIIAQPLMTVKRNELESNLKELFEREAIDTVVVGYPRTLRGTLSEQTKKIIADKEKLEKLFPQLSWILWDERLTSKQAEKMKKITTKEEKLKSHARAAALILDSYLQYLTLQKI